MVPHIHEWKRGSVMIAASVIAVSITYLFMLAGYFMSRYRFLHIPVMVSIILFDLSMPFYLYTHRNWKRRLIDQQEILSFLVWMHIGLLVTLFALYLAQIHSARRLLKGDQSARKDHHSQGRALLLVRGLVIFTGAILVSPE